MKKIPEEIQVCNVIHSMNLHSQKKKKNNSLYEYKSIKYREQKKPNTIHSE